MHELTLAQQIVAVVREVAAQRGRCRVCAINVKVGELRQVIPQALQAAFGVASRGSVAEGAELRLEWVEGRVRCRDCGGEYKVVLEEPSFQCPFCGSQRVGVVAGEGFYVESIEVEEEEE